jgi:hypothetical protein
MHTCGIVQLLMEGNHLRQECLGDVVVEGQVMILQTFFFETQ